MKNDVQNKTDVQMTAQEVSEMYNRGKKVIDFVGKKKVFFVISLGIILIGIICPAAPDRRQSPIPFRPRR